MKQAILIFIFAVFTAMGWGQTISRHTLSSTGGYYATEPCGANSVGFTVAQTTMISTFQGGNSTLTEGFQQPDTNICTGLIDITQDEFGSLVVYPNPATGSVQFGFQLPEAGKVLVSLYNDLGQKIADVDHENYDNGKIIKTVDISGLFSGMYYFILICNTVQEGKIHIVTKKFIVAN